MQKNDFFFVWTSSDKSVVSSSFDKSVVSKRSKFSLFRKFKKEEINNSSPPTSYMWIATYFAV